jgi:hypothetical protein
MATKRKAPVIAARSDEVILVQVQRKRRKGSALLFQDSKTLTVYNLTRDEVYQRIVDALQK